MVMHPSAGIMMSAQHPLCRTIRKPSPAEDSTDPSPDSKMIVGRLR